MWPYQDKWPYKADKKELPQLSIKPLLTSWAFEKLTNKIMITSCKLEPQRHRQCLKRLLNIFLFWISIKSFSTFQWDFLIFFGLLNCWLVVKELSTMTNDVIYDTSKSWPPARQSLKTSKLNSKFLHWQHFWYYFSAWATSKFRMESTLWQGPEKSYHL